MLKRLTLIIMSVCMLFGICACKNDDKDKNSDGVESGGRIVHTPSNLLGFVVEDDGEMGTRESMHSFICNAEDVGMNAKLYRFATEEELNKCVNTVIKDNCDAVLFYSKKMDYSGAAKTLEDNAIRTVSLARKADGASCSFILEKSDIEILTILAGKIQDGSILIYSSEAVEQSEIQRELADAGHSVVIKNFIRTEYAFSSAKDALYSYLVNNTSVKAIYAMGEQNARPAALAAKEISTDIVVIGCEVTDVNSELFDDGLYALAVSPYYDMTAHAVRAMEKLSSGTECSDEPCTVHLVTADKIDKYIAIMQNTVEWFDMQG